MAYTNAVFREIFRLFMLTINNLYIKLQDRLMLDKERMRISRLQ